MGSTADTAIWWVRRDFRSGGQPGAPRRLRRRRRCCRCSCSTRPCSRGAGTARRAWLMPRCTPWTPICAAAAARVSACVRGKPENVVPRVAKEVGAARVHVGGRLRAVRAAPGPSGWPTALGRAGVSWSGPDPRTRSPRAPWSTSPALRSRCSPRSTGPGSTTACTTPPRPSASRSADWLAAEDRVDLPPADDELIGLAGERQRPGAVAGVAGPGRRRGRRLPEAARRARRGRHLAPVHRPALGAPASPYGAEGPGRAAVRRCSRPGPPDRLAGLLRRRALAQAGRDDGAGAAGVQAR